MKKQLKLLGVLALGCLAFTAIPTATAVPINGTITFSPPDPSTFGTINVVGGTTSVLFPAPMLVQTTVGDYNSVALGSTATFRNFSFTGTGATSTLVGAPIIGLWQVDGFSFDLTSLLTTFIPTGAQPGAFTILGNGVAHGAGFNDTFGTFSLSGTGSGSQFTFQASTTAAGQIGVPDGGATVALLGLTLVGIECMRRKFASV